MQILVFSWWPGALSVLGEALKANGVPHALGEGKHGLKSALAAFCSANASDAALRGADVTQQRGADVAAQLGGYRGGGGGGGAHMGHIQRKAAGSAQVRPPRHPNHSLAM